MTSPAHHEATKAAMREAHCERNTYWVDVYDNPRQVARCQIHACWWDDDRDVCKEADAAARIAYDLGRRDAIGQAATAIDTESFRPDMDKHRRGGLVFAVNTIRSLASTPTNEGAETDGD